MNTYHYWTTFASETISYVFILLTIFANFILSVVLVPILITIHGPFLYLSILFISLSFGLLFSSLLHSIDSANHLIANILVPLIALINIILFTNLSNKLITLLALNTPAHQPILVGIVYVGGYVLPEIVLHRMNFSIRQS